MTRRVVNYEDARPSAIRLPKTEPLCWTGLAINTALWRQFRPLESGVVRVSPN